MEGSLGKLVNKFLSYFVRGLLFVAPVGFTILILYSAFDFVDSLVRIKFSWDNPNQEFFVPGLGFLIVLFGTAFIGFVFTRLLPQTIQNWLENGMKHLPIVKIFYTAFKDLISAFVGGRCLFLQEFVPSWHKIVCRPRRGKIGLAQFVELPCLILQMILY